MPLEAEFHATKALVELGLVILQTLAFINHQAGPIDAGTPLQNNIRELFNLVQFIDPTYNAEKLEAQYAAAEPLPSFDAVGMAGSYRGARE
jgi:hypothetical protein